MKSRYISIALLLSLSAFVVASDWPGYRGNGSASGTSSIPLTWSKTENLLWSAPLPGQGPASPIVIGNTVFVTASSGYKQDRLHVFAFDGSTGKKQWERQLWATGRTECHPKSAMAAPTPVADGERVYALFATADLVCFDHHGNMLLVPPPFSGIPSILNQVGMASSPSSPPARSSSPCRTPAMPRSSWASIPRPAKISGRLHQQGSGLEHALPDAAEGSYSRSLSRRCRPARH